MWIRCRRLCLAVVPRSGLFPSPALSERCHRSFAGRFIAVRRGAISPKVESQPPHPRPSYGTQKEDPAEKGSVAAGSPSNTSESSGCVRPNGQDGPDCSPLRCRRPACTQTQRPVGSISDSAMPAACANGGAWPPNISSATPIPSPARNMARRERSRPGWHLDVGASANAWTNDLPPRCRLRDTAHVAINALRHTKPRRQLSAQRLVRRCDGPALPLARLWARQSRTGACGHQWCHLPTS